LAGVIFLNKIYRVADYIADFLVEKNIKHSFLLPGGGNMHLVDGVGKNKKIEVVPVFRTRVRSLT
jgi:Pyruvate decarboxylase and related thiamine pyrophosphate-requiring enzymes